jgi:hypothetical protein
MRFAISGFLTPVSLYQPTFRQSGRKSTLFPYHTENKPLTSQKKTRIDGERL